MISLALILCAIATSVIAVLVLLRGKGIINLLFAGISACFAAWAIFILEFLITTSADAAMIYAKLYYLAATVFAYLLLLFIIIFPKGKLPSAQLQALIAAGCLSVVIPLLAAPHFITSQIVIAPGNNLVVLNKPSYLFFSAYFLLYFYFGISMAIKKYLHSRDHERVQVGAYAFGILLNSIPGVVTNLLLPYYGNYRYIWVGPLCSVFFIYFTAYSIIRYKMFDIRSFVIRAAGYLITSMMLSVLYIAPVIYIMATVILGYSFQWSKFIPAVLVATIAAYNFNRLRNWFDAKTAQIFFRDAYDPAVVLGDFTRLLVSTIELKRLLHDSATFIASRLKIESVSFLLNETASTAPRVMGPGTRENLSATRLRKINQYIATVPDDVIIVDYLTKEHAQFKHLLQENNVSVLIRLSNKTDKKDLGYILLDYKKSGNTYTAQDVRTLSSIADVLVIAIQNALHFEEIQNFNLTLQRRIDEATAKLRRTNIKLKALDETKDDFISMASHQLRTPLTSVKGYLSMVLEGDAGKLTMLQKKMLDQAFVSSQRMVFLIADLLNVSRLKTGKFVIEPSPVDLSRMVEDEVHQLQETAKSRSLQLLYDKPSTFPSLMLDDTKTRQVVMNFIDNAIYYTPAGGTIRVELHDSPETAELRVVDNGIGVPKAEQPHLFTKFYRAGNARKARPDGTGLGLFMAKKVIIAQGGAVIFESREGKGSTFGFVLPKAKLPAAPAPPSSDPAKKRYFTEVNSRQTN